MGLTLEAEQRMEDVGLIDFFKADEESWVETVVDTKGFVKRNFPNGARIRKDDVAKALVPVLEVHEEFKDFRNGEKLRAKYWIKDFADLLIDRIWDKIKEENDENEDEED
tara:strand:- start:945 stop:1274 length:330 start_codon:yes stop_codon:yes gene_type:complete